GAELFQLGKAALDRVPVFVTRAIEGGRAAPGAAAVAAVGLFVFLYGGGRPDAAAPPGGAGGGGRGGPVAPSPAPPRARRRGAPGGEARVARRGDELGAAAVRAGVRFWGPGRPRGSAAR